MEGELNILIITMHKCIAFIKLYSTHQCCQSPLVAPLLSRTLSQRSCVSACGRHSFTPQKNTRYLLRQAQVELLWHTDR
jgi:hypothetical protein